MEKLLYPVGQYRYLLFDLDGTLTNPGEGITRCVEYALQHFGIVVNDLRDLYPFIGPPLNDSFKEFYHFTEEQAKEASLKYHERFADTGIYENQIYEGIVDFLERAKQQGYQMMLATSKPDVFASRILDHFHLTDYFSFVGGSGLDGSRHSKADVIAYVLSENQIMDLSKVVMIGDRKHDILGAKQMGVDSIGVLYGYGDQKELEEAGANYIVGSINELEKLLFEK